MYIDTHAHLTDSAFDHDRQELIKGLAAGGIGKIIEISCDPKGFEASAELAVEFARARERARDLGKDRAHGDHARTGANERLADKAEMAKAAAEELRKNAHEVPDRERAFNRERAQGR